MAGKTKKPKMNIYQKLVEIRKEVKHLQKDKEGYGYNYTSGSKVLSSIRDKMDELGVLLSPEIIEQGKEQTLVKVWDKRASAMVEKVEWVVELKMNYTWINAENPDDKYVVPFPAFGQQPDPGQALGTALTYSERYLILKEFQIATDDLDPDALQDGKKQNVSTGKGDSKPNCPNCNHNGFVIAAKFKVEEKGKWLCWKKKDQYPTGCGEQFNTAPPGNAPETPQDAPQATNGNSRPVTLISTLNKLVDNKALFDQIPVEQRDKVTEILISDIDPNHEGIKGWIEYLTKCYAKLDKESVVENTTDKKKITTPQLKRLMAIATKNGWSEEDVNGTVKKVLNLDSKTDIPVSAYDEIVEVFSSEKVPF